MIKRFSIFAFAALIAVVMVVAPAGAKSSSSSPAKAYWYATKKAYFDADFATHVSVDKSNRLDYIRVTGGCEFYKGQSFSKLPVKLKNNKFSYKETINAYSNKDKVNTAITVQIDAKFKDGKFKGTYTISDPSSECTAAQKAKHSFSAKKRVKQVGG